MVWGQIVGGIVSGLMGGDEKDTLAQESFNLQRNMAARGLSVRVNDAEAAGLHPLAALGYQGYNINPIYTGASKSKLSLMGQNVNRALQSMKTKTERKLTEILLKQEEEKLKQMGLQTISMKRGLADINSTPSLPDATNKGTVPVGQGTGTIVEPKRVTSSDIPGQESGMIPGGQVVLMPNKRVAETITEPMSEPIESDAYQATLRFGEKIIEHVDSWLYSPALTRNYTPGGKRFKAELRARRKRLPKPPKGKHYSFNYAMNSFYLTDNKYKKSKKFRTPSGGIGLRQKIYNQRR